MSDSSKAAFSSPFALDDSALGHFESLADEESTRYWSARSLMAALGYESWAQFKKALSRAMAACVAIGVNMQDCFVAVTVVADGKKQEDFKLTRFACLLTAMNGDSKKPNVAAAQAYFIHLAMAVSDIPIPAESVDRIVIREEISDRERTLTRAAKSVGVEFYDRFQNAGYRGMYDMDLKALKRLKGMPDLKRSLLDFMGKDELAANLFRLSLTEGRIRRDGFTGQAQAEKAAESVGRRVRNAMIEETGQKPEDLPIANDIREVRRGLKDTNKGFGLFIDDLEAQRVLEAEDASGQPLGLPSIVPGCLDCANGNPFSHRGSEYCTSGSIASGGHVAHCSCDYCADS